MKLERIKLIIYWSFSIKSTLYKCEEPKIINNFPIDLLPKKGDLFSLTNVEDNIFWIEDDTEHYTQSEIDLFKQHEIECNIVEKVELRYVNYSDGVSYSNNIPNNLFYYIHLTAENPITPWKNN